MQIGVRENDIKSTECWANIELYYWDIITPHARRIIGIFSPEGVLMLPNWGCRPGKLLSSAENGS